MELGFYQSLYQNRLNSSKGLKFCILFGDDSCKTLLGCIFFKSFQKRKVNVFLVEVYFQAFDRLQKINLVQDISLCVFIRGAAQIILSPFN